MNPQSSRPLVISRVNVSTTPLRLGKRPDGGISDVFMLRLVSAPSISQLRSM